MTCSKCGSDTRVVRSFSMTTKNVRKRKCMNEDCNHVFFTTEKENNANEANFVRNTD